MRARKRWVANKTHGYNKLPQTNHTIINLYTYTHYTCIFIQESENGKQQRERGKELCIVCVAYERRHTHKLQNAPSFSCNVFHFCFGIEFRVDLISLFVSLSVVNCENNQASLTLNLPLQDTILIRTIQFLCDSPLLCSFASKVCISVGHCARNLRQKNCWKLLQFWIGI